jgi:hypothetical protein
MESCVYVLLVICRIPSDRVVNDYYFLSFDTRVC